MAQPAFHRAIVVMDVAGFTHPVRTLAHQAAVHQGLRDVLREAFAGAGIDLSTCWVEDRGDGAMVLVPPDVPKSVLAARLPYELLSELRRYNAVHARAANVQLRVALHAGEVRDNAHGVVSQAINFAFRILEADEAKHALTRTGGLLALIASDLFYQEVIAQDPAADPDSYWSIPVAVKNVSTTAWLRLPDIAPPTGHRSSTVPKVWGNVPPRNPIFTGRSELLDRLSSRLTARGTAVILPATALHGMGGIGKTQLAAEYVYRRQHLYDLVWWTQASQPGQIRASLTRLAQRLNLPGYAEADTAVPAVLEALRLGEPYRRWLLVFDAADSPEVVRPYLPTSGPGETLVTSRNPNWSDVASPVEVTIFTRDESAELFRRRGLEVGNDDADQLAEKLGHLPLAIDQAAAWQVETGMPVDEYLRLFDEKVVEILEEPPIDYAVPAGAAWNVSFDELENRNPTAYQLLQVCAFFAPEPISRRVLKHWLADPIQVSRAIRDINRYGLAKVDHRRGTLVLHRLVQLMLRARMTPTDVMAMRHQAHLILANYDPRDPQPAKQWPRYRDIFPHVYASGLLQCDDARARKLVINLAVYLAFAGDPDEAARLARRAFDSWTVKFGDDSEETVLARLLVALSLKLHGDFRAAREMCEEVYRSARDRFGEGHFITLQAGHDLAVNLRLAGDYRRALTLNEQVWRGRAEILGEDHYDTLNTFSGIIMGRRELGNYRQARLDHEVLADRIRNRLGEDSIDTLRRQGYLAVARRKDGDYAGALELSSRILARYRRTWGDNNTQAMVCAVGYSIDLRYAGELTMAREVGEHILYQMRDSLGECHPYTLSAGVDLAITLRNLGDIENARRHTEYAFGQFEATLGLDHPHAIACAINLANDLVAMGDTQPAQTMNLEALARSRRALGDDHPTTLAASLNACLDAMAPVTATLTRFRRVLGSGHPATRAAEARLRSDCDIDPLPL